MAASRNLQGLGAIQLIGGSFLNDHEDFSSMIVASFSAIAVLTCSIGLSLTAEARTTVIAS